MDFLKYFYIIAFGISILMIIVFSLKSKKFFKTLFLSAALGLLSMAIINLTSKYSGIYIPVNEFSVLASGVFSVPGVCGLLLLNLIFI